MAQTLVNIRMDEELKKSMEQTCQELGMNMTTAFTIFAKKMSREKRIPFEVSVDPFYSEKNTNALNESIAQLKEGNVVIKTIEELEEMADG
ncbi:damage-inducible protein J [Eisenbergiella tayi]|uniref:RelB antitoxin n=1 Tax=Eisenbergiella tayi TaxID=1432052 RepID=A0A1E3ASG9_9FIRM|nr:type II toxin-antitoxin system RelB/DinJ family antitoxin [Eisenbergiella tayi]ODM11668.1 RelB antitoxin [Eisenbergiella tayi]OIZ64793.1 damage-inducible protein J [Eisenbergiella tayi]